MYRATVVYTTKPAGCPELGSTRSPLSACSNTAYRSIWLYEETINEMA